MTDQEQTIDHLRSVIKTMQIKLDSRTRMLADIVPHLLSCNEDASDMDQFVIHEWYERHSEDARQFKDEYAKENGVGSSDKAELRG